MISEITKYLRELAQKCVALARECPDLSTSYELEEVATDLMAKASELEQLHLE